MVDISNFCIKTGYRPNLNPTYYLDTPAGIIYQPDVYAIAAFIAERSEITTILDVGSGNGIKLVTLAERHNIVAVDYGNNREIIAHNLPLAVFIEANLEHGLPELRGIDLKHTLVIAADVVEHLINPSLFLQGIAQLSQQCPWLLLSTPDRLRCRGAGDFGFPANPCHVREWALDEFDLLLRSFQFASFALGYTVNTNHHLQKTGLLALSGTEMFRPGSKPLSVLAIVHFFNEQDVLSEVVAHLISEGVDVHLVDNWSTDGSWELAQQLAEKYPKRVNAVRFPQESSAVYEWEKQLNFTVEQAAISSYEWIMHYDADEFRESPWLGVSLAEAISFVDHCGYNAIDFTVLDFRPVRPDPQIINLPIKERLPFFEFGRRPGHFQQIKAWKNQPGVTVNLAATGGHRADFLGRRVFPLKFLNRHYSLRSQSQARQKIFFDRRTRFSLAEKQEKGWHSQYDQFSQESSFIWETSKLDGSYHPQSFSAEFFVERLSGIGLNR